LFGLILFSLFLPLLFQVEVISPAISSPKASGWDFYRHVLGSPKFFIAPMVGCISSLVLQLSQVIIFYFYNFRSTLRSCHSGCCANTTALRWATRQ
jgi:hypothetical protein